MSLCDKKILVSGCGFSWGGQQRKTWVNVLRACGADIVDVGGPAVSNQWIFNQAFEALLIHQVDSVIIQLTSLKKLDVEITENRQLLVDNDSLRNFTVNGVWPSSVSTDHESKQLYYQWLCSPGLETQELFTKIMLLDHWCKSKAIELFVYQAYSVPWTEFHKTHLRTIIRNYENPLYDQYQLGQHYKNHDYTNHNTVPTLDYQIEFADHIAQTLQLDIVDKIKKLQAQVKQK